MEVQIASRQEKKERLLHFLEIKREQRKEISRERKEARKVLLAKKAIPFSRVEKKEKLLQYLKERKEQLLAVKKAKEDLRLKAIAKRKAVAEEKAAVKVKAVVVTEAPVEAPPLEALPAERPKEEVVKPVPKEAVKRKPVARKIELRVFFRRYGLRILFLLLFLAWAGEAFLFYSMVYRREEKSNEASVVKKKFSPKGEKDEIKIAIRPELFESAEIKIVGERDPFSGELFRMGVLVTKPEVIKFKPIIREEKPEKIPIVIPPLIPEKEKLLPLAKIGRPEVSMVSLPEPTCPLRYRGRLEIAGIEYLFIEGEKPHRAIVGDIIEGYHLFNKIEDTIYLSKEGYIFQVRRERLLCPLHYRGRLIIDGKEYLFLEGERTYRVALGETAEGYQVIRRIGNILYLLKENNIFELKEE